VLPPPIRYQSGKPDSNRRPQPWQGCALPTELFPQRFTADIKLGKRQGCGQCTSPDAQTGFRTFRGARAGGPSPHRTGHRPAVYVLRCFARRAPRSDRTRPSRAGAPAGGTRRWPASRNRGRPPRAGAHAGGGPRAGKHRPARRPGRRRPTRPVGLGAGLGVAELQHVGRTARAGWGAHRSWARTSRGNRRTACSRDGRLRPRRSRTLSGIADYAPAMGPVAGRVSQDVTRLDLGLHIGVTDWWTVGCDGPPDQESDGRRPGFRTGYDRRGSRGLTVPDRAGRRRCVPRGALVGRGWGDGAGEHAVRRWRPGLREPRRPWRSGRRSSRERWRAPTERHPSSRSRGARWGWRSSTRWPLSTPISPARGWTASPL
jgi:hypothetical protein